MTDQRLIRALLSDKPYFGHVARALQGVAARHKYLPAFLKKAAERRPSGNIRILEIGSWAGASAITWAKSLQELGRQGEVVCVDTWAPYLDLDANAADIYAEMDRAARDGIVKQLFDHNIRTAGVGDLIKTKIGRSAKVLPRLKEKSFDLIYIDGDHVYAAVRADIIHAKRLVRKGGVICGDDLEASADEIHHDLLERYCETSVEYVESAESNRSFHPGVTKAVSEELGKVSCWEGAWAIVWDGRTGRTFDIDPNDVPLPAHIADAVRADRPGPVARKARSPAALRRAHKPLVFMHIPKTAGTSFRHVCESALGSENVLFVHAWAEWQHHRHSFKDKMIIGGHVTLPFIRYCLEGDDFHLVTFLRNPIERIISNYYYCRSEKNIPLGFHAYCRLFSLSQLSEFVNNPTENDLKWTLNNHYARCVLGHQGVEALFDRPDEMFERASEAYGQFDYIGISEKFDIEVQSIFAKFFPGINVSPYSDVLANNRFTNSTLYPDSFEFQNGESLDEAACKRLRALNEVDIRLYNHIATPRYPELKCFGLPATAAALAIEPDPDFAKWVVRQTEWKLAASQRAIIVRDQPKLVEQNINGHNIVGWAQRFYALPQARGTIDLPELSSAELAEFLSDSDLSRLRARLLSPSEAPASPATPATPGAHTGTNEDLLRPGLSEPLRSDEAHSNGLDAAVLASELTARDRALDNLRQEIAAHTANSNAIQRDLTQHSEHLARVEVALAEIRGATADGLRQEVAAHAAAGGAIQRDLMQHSERLALVEAALAKNQSASDELRQGIAAGSAIRRDLTLHSERLALVEGALAKSQSAADELRQGIAARAAAGSAIQRDLTRHSEHLALVEVALAESQGATNELRQAVAARVFRGTATERDLAIQAERITLVEKSALSLEQTVERQIVGLRNIEQTLDRRTTRIESLEGTLDERSAQIASLVVTIDERTARIVSLEATLAKKLQRLAQRLRSFVPRFSSLGGD